MSGVGREITFLSNGMLLLGSKMDKNVKVIDYKRKRVVANITLSKSYTYL